MRRKAHPHEPHHELNIVPYLDIMVNLVMFMLAGMSGFIVFQIINVNAPDVAESSLAADPSTPPPKPEENLILNVSIGNNGYYIAGTGAVLPGEAAAGSAAADPSSLPPTLPLKDGAFDYDGLTRKMQQIKNTDPWKRHSQVIIAADAKVRYEVVVKTMDAVRADAAGALLFPDVAFGAFTQ